MKTLEEPNLYAQKIEQWFPDAAGVRGEWGVNSYEVSVLQDTAFWR